MKSDGQSQTNRMCNILWTIGQSANECTRFSCLEINCFHFGHLSIWKECMHTHTRIICRHAFGQSDALTYCEHLLIEITLVRKKKTNKILRPYLTCSQMHAAEKKKEEHTNLCIIVLYFMRFNLRPVISLVQAQYLHFVCHVYIYSFSWALEHATHVSP